MIDAKQAVEIAKEAAANMLGPNYFSLEELERDVYKRRDVWRITLGLPRRSDTIPPLAQLSADQLQYKLFLIDAKTGELIAMKLREPALQ